MDLIPGSAKQLNSTNFSITKL